MLIGTRYADNKLYRGIKHYDNLPLTSGDLHEYADTMYMKNSYFMNNFVGSGTINEPKISTSSTGISLLSPSVLLVDGDISLIQSNGNLVTMSEIEESGVSNGLVCIVGWYQHITASSTIREYGGVNNNIIPNDIIDSNLGLQVSSRYQFRWDKVIVDKGVFNSESSTISFTLRKRDEHGNLSGDATTQTINTSKKVGNIRVADKPSFMTYAASDLYIVPILQFTYNNSILNALPAKSIKNENALIKSTSEPKGNIGDGTIWYDSGSSRFYIYIEGVGFIPTSPEITLMQYSNTVTISTATTTPANVKMSIGIDAYTEEDILQVIYEGVVLTEGLHYTLNPKEKTVSLLNFTTKVGDKVTFICMRLIDSTTSNTISTEFSLHVNSIGSAKSKGHVNLTDTVSVKYDELSGIAATPKSVYDATTLIDSVTNKKYRLSVTDGVLGIQEVV